MYWIEQLARLDKRYDELEALLTDETFVEQYPHSSQSWRWYQEYKANGVLPFAGGQLDQPAWFWDDVWWFRVTEEYEVDIPRDRRYTQERINKTRNGSD